MLASFFRVLADFLSFVFPLCASLDYFFLLYFCSEGILGFLGFGSGASSGSNSPHVPKKETSERGTRPGIGSNTPEGLWEAGEGRKKRRG